MLTVYVPLPSRQKPKGSPGGENGMVMGQQFLAGRGSEKAPCPLRTAGRACVQISGTPNATCTVGTLLS